MVVTYQGTWMWRVQEEENEAEDVEVPTEVLDFFLISSPALHDILHIRYGI